MTKLKSCPFCKSDKVYCIHSFAGPHIIKCTNCNAIVSFRHKYEQEEVIEAWNHRSRIAVREEAE